MKPGKDIQTEQDRIYEDLVHGKEIDWNSLNGTLEFIDKQYDCSDFRYVNLVRILYEFGDQIPEKTLSRIEKTLFDFRYWWDEPGENSMCYWSENHQILFASAEYLCGQLYPDVVFANSGLTGREHMEKARKRALDWLEMRWAYGFTEFNSGVYYKEDIGAMINLIDFARDEELVEKTMIIMDLLLYDVAVQNINTMFVSASGRAYTGNRMGGKGADLGGVTNYYWGDGSRIRQGMMQGMMSTRKYRLPSVIKEIATDTSDVIIKQNNGLDIIELDEEGYFGRDNRSMMMQLGMESFTNPEIVRNTLSFIRDTRMFSNEFVKDFKVLDITLLRCFHLEPALIRMLNPRSNGVAIQKGNTYTYRTKDYSLYSVQNYHPGTYGDQHHVAGMNISNHFSIFHSHPAVEVDSKQKSPNYWVGYGRLPHVAQDLNVSMSIYNIPDKKGFMESALLDYTHAYFPTEMFDTVIFNQNYLFGKKGDTYAVLIANNDLKLRSETTDDIIQEGKQTFWITEAGSIKDEGSFEDFHNRILKNKLNFNQHKLHLTYSSNGNEYKLEFAGNYYKNTEIVNVNYDRYDSPYCKAGKKASEISIHCNGKSLFLDFENGIRRFDE